MMTGPRVLLLEVLLPLLATAALAAQAAPDCAAWHTREYFRTATAEEVTACLDSGADVNARDGFGIMPLHWAAQFNADPAVLETLLAAGADLGARDDFVGYTPLHRAARYNANPAVFEVVIIAGADLGARDDAGSTPLHLAAEHNANPAVLEVLITAGADVEDRDGAGHTSLQLAARGRRLGAVEALLAAGADADLGAPGRGYCDSLQVPATWAPSRLCWRSGSTRRTRCIAQFTGGLPWSKHSSPPARTSRSRSRGVCCIRLAVPHRCTSQGGIRRQPLFYWPPGQT